MFLPLSNMMKDVQTWNKNHTFFSKRTHFWKKKNVTGLDKISQVLLMKWLVSVYPLNNEYAVIKVYSEVLLFLWALICTTCVRLTNSLFLQPKLNLRLMGQHVFWGWEKSKGNLQSNKVFTHLFRLQNIQIYSRENVLMNDDLPSLWKTEKRATEKTGSGFEPGPSHCKTRVLTNTPPYSPVLKWMHIKKVMIEASQFSTVIAGSNICPII